MIDDQIAASPGDVTVPDFLPYHKQLADLLEQHEEGLWSWFASDNMAEQAFDDHRLFLLKNSVRLDADTYGDLYGQAQHVADMLGITAPLTLFQGQGDSRNAALIFIPGEVNVIFQGDLMEFLSPDEMTSVLAHEMAHFLHQTRDEGRYFNTDRLLDWICGEPRAHQAHGTSMWLSRLYQEIFADRVGLFACKDRDAAISSLVKVGSGLSKVSVDAYLAQAREALEMNKGDGTAGQSHPETYVRAIALSDWAEDPDTADEKLVALVEGTAKLERLDLLKQTEMAALTRAVISTFLADDWGDTELMGMHAKAFFIDYARPDTTSQDTDNPLVQIAQMDDSLKEFFAYVLADFATVDPDLEDTPLMAAFDFSAQWGFAEAFDEVVLADLKLTIKKVRDIRSARAEATT